MAQTDVIMVLQDNPLILWGGIILAAIIFLIARHLENRGSGRDVPEPTTLDKIVKPKVKEHLRNRGRTPGEKTYFKIGRDQKGLIHRYVNTELPEKLIDPNPKNKSKESGDMEEVRIIEVKPAKRLERILEKIMAAFTRSEPDRKLYVFKQDAFIDTPGTNEMMVDDDVMSYTYGGMEVQLDTSSRNTINQAVQTVVAEKLLASLPNYTEKVDYLFPLHSQEITRTKEERKGQGDW